MMTNSLTAEELMHKARRRGIQVDWDKALIPLSLVVMVLLRFVLNAPVWALGLMCLWMPLYYVVYPMILHRKWTGFEKEFAINFQRGDHKALLNLYERQWFLRRFGPRAEMLGKLGLIYTALERYREAEHALERAVDQAAEHQKDRLYFSLANVKFELGKLDAAEQIYRALKPNSPYRQSIQTHLALIDMHRGKRTDEARRVLEHSFKSATGNAKERIRTALEQ